MLAVLFLLVKSIAFSAGLYGGACVVHDVAVTVGKKVYSAY